MGFKIKQTPIPIETYAKENRSKLVKCPMCGELGLRSHFVGKQYHFIHKVSKDNLMGCIHIDNSCIEPLT